jgi:beta-N-acetylhexosaminidase
MPNRSTIKRVLTLILILTVSAIHSGCSSFSQNNTPTVSPEIQQWVNETMASMTLEEKVGQLIVTGIDGNTFNETTCLHVQSIKAGGITFQSHNVVDPQQMRELTANLNGCLQDVNIIPPFMMISSEGEYVTRFQKNATIFPSALALGATDSPELAYKVYLAAGQELAYSGFNMVLGPVADVLTDYDNEVVSQRSYHGDPLRASQFVLQAVSGYQDAGIITVLKHFPGHGGVAEDSHATLPIDPASRSDLESTYLPPFRAGIEAGSPVVMFSHIAFPKIAGGNHPTTFSPEMVSLLRKELGFQGIILSDSMRMKAVAGKNRSIMRASLEAIKAGVNVVLLNDPGQAVMTYQFILERIAEKEITHEPIDAAVRQILTVKAQWGLNSFQPNEAPQPDWTANNKLALQAGEQSVTLYRDQADLVPLPADQKRILIVGPVTDWPMYDPLVDWLAQHDYKTEFRYYSPPWEGAVTETDWLEHLPAEVEQYDFALVFTYQAHLNSITISDPWQVHLVNQLINAGLPTAVIALRSPTDLLDFSQVPTFIGTFGTNPGAMQGLWKILFGQAQARGTNPLPGLP